MIAIVKTGMCENCGCAKLFLGQNLDYTVNIYCEHYDACLRVYEITKEQDNGQSRAPEAGET